MKTYPERTKKINSENTYGKLPFPALYGLWTRLIQSL